MVIDSGFWRPSAIRVLGTEIPRIHAARERPRSDAVALAGVMDWLVRAQDATVDEGISWGYQLRRGWHSSYPETTGYLVTTLLDLAEFTGDRSFVERARRAVRFLDSIRLPNGAYPGLTVEENSTEPSVFNTAQIINGLLAWHRVSDDHVALDHARAAGDWLLSVQDTDGAWRRHVYNGVAVTYLAHAACWVADLGVRTGDQRFLAGARTNLEWVLAQQDPRTGWFERCGFDENELASRISTTHTIAYTIWGVLHTSIVLGRPDGVAAARTAAEALGVLLDRVGWIPGILDSSWARRSDHMCLTGTAQIALIWLRLAAVDQDPAMLRRARRAIDLVKSHQRTDGPPGIRGGIAGSAPIWGSYIRFAYPNWAAKFFADALMELDRQERGAGLAGG